MKKMTKSMEWACVHRMRWKERGEKEYVHNSNNMHFLLILFMDLSLSFIEGTIT